MLNKRDIKRIVRRILAPIVFSAIAAATVLIILQRVPLLHTWFGLISNSAPEWYMQSYYNTVNQLKTQSEEDPDIVLLDLNEHISRHNLADLLHLIAESSPKVIGVDCIFSPSESYDSAQTNYLVRSLSQFPDTVPIVFATILKERSTLPDSILHHIGFVDFSGFYDYKAYSNGTAHMAVEMARIAGYNVDRIDTSSFLVNYRNLDFFTIPIMPDFSEYADYIQEHVKEKVVLIGSVNNKWDMHAIPFVINNSETYIAGIEIVAYSLASIISERNYSRCPWWMNVLIIIAFMLVYIVAYIGIEAIQKRWHWFILIKPILLFLMIVLILVFSMLMTAGCHYVPDVVFFMVGTAFMGFFYSALNTPTTKKKEVISVREAKLPKTRNDIKRKPTKTHTNHKKTIRP